MIYLAESVASPRVQLFIDCQRGGVRFGCGHVRHDLTSKSLDLSREDVDVLVAMAKATASPVPPREKLPACGYGG